MVSRTRSFNAGASVLAVWMLAACQRPAVEWRGLAQRVATLAESEEAAQPVELQLVMRPDGAPAIDSIIPLMTTPAAQDSAACVGSIRTASSTRAQHYGVWWSMRDGGSAALLAARSDDGGATWTAPVPVDTTDRWAVACSRPAPAIAADSASGYVHVTYFLNGPDGPGIFFSHSMDRGALFHAPVPILYGARPSQTAIAAEDSVVVVAFEDPNSKRSLVSLAVSRTWGHVFLRERPEASSMESPAQRPLVALRDSLVAVGWHGPDRSVVARVGTIRLK